MTQPTATRFFLGANSRYGFHSLYNEFCNGPQDRLHIIKAGPGTGKSTFMRRIGEAAEARGYDVEYILCSGDPHSLDCVYIPALHVGWADGTAPHTLDPEFFGISGVYENLGRFCDCSHLIAHEEAIRNLTNAYRKSYRHAYACLSAAGALESNFTAELLTEAEHKLRNRAKAKISNELTHSVNLNSHPIRRFIRALSCKGNYILAETLECLCDRLCVLSSTHGLEQLFFEEIETEVTARNIPAIICPSPLSPSRTEAVILPEQRLCFLSEHILPPFSGKVRTIHLDAYLPAHMKKNTKKQERKLQQQLLENAYQHLAEAKRLHDQLEACYRPSLDIAALDQYTQSIIDDIFR